MSENETGAGRRAAPRVQECGCDFAYAGGHEPTCPQSTSTKADAAALALQARQEPPLITYMTTDDPATRDAAFLRTYAVRVRDKSEQLWEIPNTRASTLEDIAKRIEERVNAAEAALQARAREQEELQARHDTLKTAFTENERFTDSLIQQLEGAEAKFDAAEADRSRLLQKFEDINARLRLWCEQDNETAEDVVAMICDLREQLDALLAAGAPRPQPQEAQEDQSRVDGVPGSEHGDLPRPRNGDK